MEIRNRAGKPVLAPARERNYGMPLRKKCLHVEREKKREKKREGERERESGEDSFSACCIKKKDYLIYFIIVVIAWTWTVRLF